MHSADARQLDLFDPDRWPRRPWCTDDLAAGLRVRSLKQALTRAYIQPNPPHLRIWSLYDVDRPGAALAWDDANLPPPSWTATNRSNGHAHLAWGLSAPVLVDSPDLRQGPLRYLCAVESAFRARLEADDGFAGLVTKNPAAPVWSVLRGPRLAYELGELADWVELPKHLPRRAPERVGVGRNVAVFDTLRHWAYRNLRHYRPAGGIQAWNAWMSACNSRALVINADACGPVPLDGREVWHIAKSVAKWTWRRFDLQASDQRFSKLQSRRRSAAGTRNLIASHRNAT